MEKLDEFIALSEIDQGINEMEAVIPCESLIGTRDATKECALFKKALSHFVKCDGEKPVFVYIMDVNYVPKNRRGPQASAVRARFVNDGNATTRTRAILCRKSLLGRLRMEWDPGTRKVRPVQQAVAPQGCSARGAKRRRKEGTQGSRIVDPSRVPFSVNLKKEEPSREDLLKEGVSSGGLRIASVRLQQRWSAYPHRNIRVDFCKISQGNSKMEACAQEPRFCIEVEVIHDNVEDVDSQKPDVMQKNRMIIREQFLQAVEKIFTGWGK